MQYSRIIKAAFVAALMASAPMASALDASYYHTSSALTTGKWVKIRVTESGMQQITYDQLRSWGFTDPSKVTVHGYGGVVGVFEDVSADVPDDLPAQPVMYRDDRLLFYGEANFRNSLVYWSEDITTPVPGIERNNNADAGYYFVTDSCEPVEIPTIPYVGSDEANVVNHHMSLRTYEEEVDNHFGVGQMYFGPEINASNPNVRTSFNLDDRDTGTSFGNTVYAHVIAVGAGTRPLFVIEHSSGASSFTKSIALTQNGTNEYYSTNANNTAQSYITTNLNASRSKFDFRIAIASSGNFTYAALDRLSMCYPRQNRIADNAQLLLTNNDLASGDIYRFTEANADIEVWNVGMPYNVRRYETAWNADDSQLDISIEAAYKATRDSRAWRAIAFNPTKDQLPVQYVGEVANQDIHSIDVPDMIIVTTQICRPAAEELARLHHDILGHEVVILSQDDIFNEFSSGTPSPWGIRRMVKMFYDRDPRMKNLLLFGGGSFDNRGITRKASGYFNEGALLLTYGAQEYEWARTATRSYCADSYYGIVGDDAPLSTHLLSREMLVNVGRISALDASKAHTAVEKIRRYLTNFPDVDVTHRTLIVADAGDDNSHMKNAEETVDLINEYAPGSTAVKGYNSLYEWDGTEGKPLRGAIANALLNGVSYFNYNGHGSPSSFMRNIVWRIRDINTTNNTFYPFAMLATCDAYEFDKTSTNMAEEMVFNSNGGMIAVIGATRTVYQLKNQVLNTEVSRAYAQADVTTTTGDIFRIARNAVIAGNPADADLYVNTACYNLCGDPALPLYTASPRIFVDSINNADYDSEATFEIAPLTTNTLSGFVALPNDGEGEPTVDTSFNGYVILTLYESPEVRSTYSNRTLGEVATKIVTDEDAIGQYKAEVRGGRFTVNFTPAMQSREGATNRVTLLAVSESLDGTFPLMVKGHINNTVVVADLEPSEITDVDAPVISELYIDTPDFKEGDIVGGSFTVYAKIEPDASGIRTVSSAVGGNARLTFDNNRVFPVVGTSLKVNADGSVEMSFPVDSFNDGRHEMEFTISDYSGNTGSRSLEFIVMNAPATATMKVNAIAARTEVDLDITHTFTAAPTGRLVIEDANGDVVFSRDRCTFPYTWGLYDNEGEFVADGVYNVYAILSAGLQYATTPKAEVVVVKDHEL